MGRKRYSNGGSQRGKASWFWIVSYFLKGRHWGWFSIFFFFSFLLFWVRQGLSATQLSSNSWQFLCLSLPTTRIAGTRHPTYLQYLLNGGKYLRKKQFTTEARTQVSKNSLQNWEDQSPLLAARALEKPASLVGAGGVVYEVEVSSGDCFKRNKSRLGC